MSLKKRGHIIALTGSSSWMKGSPKPTNGGITKMFWFKACPRCRGDLYWETDAYGPYVTCLQCSHYLTGAEEARVKLPTSRLGTRRVLLQQTEKVAV